MAVLVLDGSVELTNDRGTVVAHENETAEIRAGGGPPTISRVLNAADRVQWLAAYVPAPPATVPGMSSYTQCAYHDTHR